MSLEIFIFATALGAVLVARRSGERQVRQVELGNRHRLLFAAYQARETA